MNLSKREMEFPEAISNVIIAMKGLSCTGKSIIAKLISAWARCPMVSIDDLLDALSLEKRYTAHSLPSREEAERLHRLAFTALFKGAYRNLCFPPFRVVIKSRLCTLLELDVLIRLANSRHSAGLVIIIECQMKNEHRFRNRLEHKVETFGREEWYKARSWKDIVNAREEDCVCQQAWEDHLRRLITNCRDDEGNSPLVIRLVLDVFDDLNIEPYQDFYMDQAFLDAINYLLLSNGDKEDSNKGGEYSEEDFNEELIKGSYAVVHYDKLQRCLFKKELKASAYRERSNYLCATKGGDCVFKYWEKLQGNIFDFNYDDEEEDASFCGVCEEQVLAGKPAYTCFFCILTLHKSCTDMLNFKFLQRIPYYSLERPSFVYSEELQEKHACNSCMDGRKDFSNECESCLFQTHLKCKLLPTIIKHNSHKHILSIRFIRNYLICKACGELHDAVGYICHICKYYYEMECIFLPAQVKHEHGGYEHVMKLMYSHEGMEQEEPYWCDSCYCDMDPQNWFYYCQECPYYVTHTECVGKQRIIKARYHNNLPIQE